MRYIGFIKSRPLLFKVLLKLHKKSIPINAKNISEESEYNIREGAGLMRKLRDRGILKDNRVTTAFLSYAKSEKGQKYPLTA